MAKSRAPVIDRDVIEVVQAILSSWSGKLTWDLLIAAIKKGIRVEYTRQALANHKVIVEEFNQKKRALQLAAGRPQPTDVRVDKLQKEIDSLKAKNEHLTVACNNYEAKFIVWTANAVRLGISESELNVPLDPSPLQSTDDIVPIYDAKRRKKKG